MVSVENTDFRTTTKWIYVVATVLALVGLTDALYLTIQHLSGSSVPCSVTGGCEEVLTSSYAVLAGIPLAGIGAAAYFSAFSLSILAAFGYRSAAKLLLPLVGTMVLVSVWLFYLQAAVIRAFCQFCLLSAGITIALAIVVFLAWKKGS
ncbi:MAG TPA: vitamin K epoxide reductase family protein [Pyrinomonadaceae bacterium]|nr:vitamin K epoxide reductase family protein [Pyrinomonadaceae bacterium]